MKRDETIFLSSAALISERAPHVVCTVIRTAGSTPRQVGTKMLVKASGEIIGTLGGGRFEFEIVAAALSQLAKRKPSLVKFHLTHDLAMCCGGEMEVFLDPIVPPKVLLLFGGGHVSHAVAPLASAVGFDVWVIDELDEFASRERFPDARGFVGSFSPHDWSALPLNGESFCVIATRDHAVDQALLEALLARETAYLGVIGSRGKRGRFEKRLAAKGFSQQQLSRVRMPVGLDIGAETPTEIAVSIVSELISVRANMLSDAANKEMPRVCESDADEI